MKTARYLQSVFTRFFVVIKDKGIAYVLIFSFNFIFSRVISFFLNHHSEKSFVFNKENYRYFYHHYNQTWLNERCVELTILKEILNKGQKENLRILEAGNVLSNYFDIHHEIIDKYDKHDFVIKEDIIDFSPEKKYDLIICISTLEHVGWDEIPKNPEKIFAAFINLKSLLNDTGTLYVTLPIGENAFMDDCLLKGLITFDEQFNFKKVSKKEWIETTWDEIKQTKRDSPFRFSNAFILGVARKRPNNN